MKYRIDGHTFADGEVALESVERELIRSPRQLPLMIRETHRLRGEILVDSSATSDQARQDDLKTKMQAIEDALVDGPSNAGLLHANESPSQHYFEQAQTWSGIRVSPVSWAADLGVGPEYSALRSFSFEVSADTLVTGYDDIFDWRETVTVQGTGGPRNVLIELDFGPPQIQQVSTNTPVFATQSGLIIGATDYIATPGPLYGGEIFSARTVSLGSPQRIGEGNGSAGSGRIAYPKNYSYKFQAATALSLIAPGGP